MPDDLVALAKRLVQLDSEASVVREQMRALLDGPTGRPSKPVAGLNGGGRAAAADGKVLDALKAAPDGLTQAEVAQALDMAMSSTGNRLSRLEAAGLATKDGRRWLPTASPPPSAPT
jgi:hypothetical protein